MRKSERDEYFFQYDISYIRLLTRLTAIILFLCITFADVESFAYMTLFNDDGGWQAGMLGSDEDDKRIYRLCRNSKDRHASDQGAGSLALLCLSVEPGAEKVSLGVWHAEDIGAGENTIPCAITLDDSDYIYDYCKISPAFIGKSSVVLTEDKNVIAHILSQKSFTVFLGSRSQKQPMQFIEFDVELERLRESAQPFRKYFEFLFKELH